MSLYTWEGWRETDYVATALAACQSDEERLTFLRRWFQGTGARHIAADPVRRGSFARVADLTPRELGQWNIFCSRAQPPLQPNRKE